MCLVLTGRFLFSLLLAHCRVHTSSEKGTAPQALLLVMVGGVTRKLNDGVKLRGDIHACLMGAPRRAAAACCRIAPLRPLGDRPAIACLMGRTCQRRYDCASRPSQQGA
jgi:MCM P-loop domain